MTITSTMKVMMHGQWTEWCNQILPSYLLISQMQMLWTETKIISYFQYNIDGSNVNEETVGHLRQRLNVMREIVKDEDKDGKKKGKRRKGKCIDTIIDGR